MTLTEKKVPKPIETIIYTVNRGLDEVTEQTAAELNFFQDHLEHIYNYKFNCFATKQEDNARAVSLHKKNNLTVFLTAWYNEMDTEKREFPRVELISNGITCCLYADEKEAYKIYNKIKTWMMNG